MASTTLAPDPATTWANLRKAANLHAVAHLLGFKPKALAFVLYQIPTQARYTRFEIPKKAGGVRTIFAPGDQLKLLQRRLADRLLDCLAAIEAESGKPDTTSHGFLPGKSTFTNATIHKKQRYVFNVDLANFFSAINFGRVRGYFINNKNFKMAPAAATVLAQIACHDPDAKGLRPGPNSFLPQGSPCSPVISNLIGNLIDRQLAGIAKQNKCRYSRYADDMTFSSSKKDFPAAIATRLDDEHTWIPGKGLTAAIETAGFELNPAKTRMQYRSSRQEVTGLVVNSIANTPPEYRRRIRAMVRTLTTKGHFLLGDKELSSDADLQKLAGMLGYVSHIDRTRLKATGAEETSKRNTLSSRERVYQRFLFYRHFYASELPVILTEGKTDTIYLKFAFQALSKKYPQFFAVSDGDKLKRNVRIFDYSEKHTNKLMCLEGGVGDLSSFLRSYFREANEFKAPAGSPTLILVDRDDGFHGKKGGLFNTLKQLVKEGEKAPETTDPYFCLGHNVYVVPTPPIAGGESHIEDFFDEKTLAHELNGKTFHHEGQGFDKSKHYSKHLFSTQVIIKHAGEIDFSGFEPLLSQLAAVLAHAGIK